MLELDDFFSARDLGLEGLNQYINVNISELDDDSENVLAVLEVQEPLRFHVELDAKYPSESPLFTEDGELTEDGFRSLERLITERYKGEYVELGGDTPEDAYVKFELVLKVPAATTPEDLGVKFWEDTALVQFHNESDPGTFGTQYLFGTLIAEYQTELTD